ncbi:MAG: peptidylprolyl isomerase [Patescibacteria group bacterium]|nr:peptidylprolyl isomerase [Patescibacteria group bacterium]
MKKTVLFSILLISFSVMTGCSDQGTTDKDNIQQKQEEVDSSKLSSKLKTKKTKEPSQTTKKETTMNEDRQTDTPEIDLSYLEKYSVATLKTSAGDISLEFFSNDAPKTVSNFFKLSEKKFYDGVTFHRVIKDFMIQGGDPNSKDDDPSNDGQGGPGYTIPAEIGLKNTKGTLATARLGDSMNPERDSSGSQFFINSVNNSFLDGQYTVFGKVTSGMDIVEKIENTKTGANDRPIDDIVIKSVELTKK